MLPRQVLHDIEKLCMAFPWPGEYSSHKVGYVKWSKVFNPKNAGGFGIRNVSLGVFMKNRTRKIDLNG